MTRGIEESNTASNASASSALTLNRDVVLCANVERDAEPGSAALRTLPPVAKSEFSRVAQMGFRRKTTNLPSLLDQLAETQPG